MKRIRKGILCAITSMILVGCTKEASDSAVTSDQPKENTVMVGQGFDGTYQKVDGLEVIYLAGGCFWGMEKLVQALPGVVSGVNGYANGDSEKEPTYQLVCTGGTGFKETVRVTYDPKKISLPQILQAFFLVIDPTIKNRQGNDIGLQYQTGIYYNDTESEKTVERIIAAEEKKYEVFVVEHEPLINFYDAEEYHQDYLEKNPSGYCHIPAIEIDKIAALVKAEVKYEKPSDEQLQEILSQEEYNVTQNGDTELPFSSQYTDFHEEGIYVDITTGQPLFKSSDKYTSSCGWPSFSAPIYEGVVQYIQDDSHGMNRTEVRSDIGDAHLGHVFYGDAESPNGVRYCINGASLRFVPKDKMIEEGYEPYLILLYSS